MQMLSRKSLYALHALIYISGSAKRTVQANWISKAKKIPRKFLEVIMLDLKNAEILGSKQGKGGGYYLKKDPREISVLEIINIIDGGFLRVPCLNEESSPCPTCLSGGDCLLKNKLGAVMEEARDNLLKTSIYDFANVRITPSFGD